MLDDRRRRARKRKPRELPREKPTRAEREKKPALRLPGPRGWLDRARGEASVIDPVEEWRGTTVQVCGLHPFSIGTGTPMIGVPMGLQLFTGATVCADPVSWFQDARARTRRSATRTELADEARNAHQTSHDGGS